MNETEFIESKIYNYGWDIITQLRCSGKVKKEDTEILLQYLEEYKISTEKDVNISKRSTALLFFIYREIGVQFRYICPPKKSDLYYFYAMLQHHMTEIFGGLQISKFNRSQRCNVYKIRK